MENTRILLLLLFHSYVAHAIESRVQIEEGILVGRKISTHSGRCLHAFTGIPYAEPPIGNLRFQDPVTKQGWNGILNAQKAGNACVQLNGFNKIIGDEDCLTLNVYTPKLHSIWKSLLPVMVFIHGGTFISGEGGPNEYSPRYLLDKVDLILVTMNYRLNVFGFLNTGDRNAPGNFGLKDQRLALQWVHRNIHEFGGDSNRITLFGHSAGGISVAHHALSESSKPYFQQYILQSGVVLSPAGQITNPRFYDYATLIASKLHCPTTNTSIVMECLRHRSPTKVFEASNTVKVENGIEFLPSREPKYDNAFLSDTVENLLKQGKLKDAPVIFGMTKMEGLVLTAAYYVNDTLYQALRLHPEEEMRHLLNVYQLVQRKNDTELAARSRQFYFGKTLPPNRNTFLRRLTEFTTDYYSSYPFAVQRDIFRRQKYPVYMYMYNFIGRESVSQLITQDSEVMGACHGDELYYLLDWTLTFNPRFNKRRTQSEYRNIQLLVDFWTSFAINGEPKSNLLLNPEMWIDATCKDAYIQIGDEHEPQVILKKHFMEKRIEFWRNVTPELPI